MRKITVDCPDALDEHAVCNFDRVVRRNRRRRNLVHIPVGEILRGDMVAGHLGGLGEIEAACGGQDAGSSSLVGTEAGS